MGNNIFLVVDDHETVLEGTVPALQQQYPDAIILTAQDRSTAEGLVQSNTLSLVVVDLSIPEVLGTHQATADVGLTLVKTLLESNAAPNIAVLSTNINPLVRLKNMIREYGGGFAAIDKSLPLPEMLQHIEYAMRGSVYLPNTIKSRPEFHAKWLQVLKLRFEEGLSDKAIAKRMSTSDRTIRNYWIRIQDTLLISDDPDWDVRSKIAIEAKKMGLIN